MNVFYVKTVRICRRLDAKPLAADEYLRFFSKKKCSFLHFLLKIYLYLLQKYLQHVTETWISVIWLIHSACSMMINTLAMTSTRTIVSRTQLRLHFMQKALSLLMILW